MTLLVAFTLIMIALSLGDIIATKTKAIIPSVFVGAVLFLFGYWTIFPKDILDIAGFPKPFIYLSMYLLVTHMGTMLSISELIRQWKTIAIALAGIVGICMMTMTLGSQLFGHQTAVVATPPLTGGIVAAIIMSERATELGLPAMSFLAILTYVMQGFAGYPLTAIMLKREGKRLLNDYRNGKIVVTETAAEPAVERKKLIPPLPEKYQTTYIILLKLGSVAMLAFYVAKWLKPFVDVSAFVYCLIFGVIFQELGYLEQKPLNKAESFGILITALMAFVFAGLSNATPEMLGEVALPLIGIIVLGVIGMAILSMLLGKLLKESLPMAFSIALTALYGFPPNYILTKEAVTALAESEEEHKYLMDVMLPKMLVGGFTTVTIVSVILAGIFVAMLK